MSSALVGSKKDQIKSLRSYCTPAQVALAVDCDPSYISQLMADEGFAAEVIASKIRNLESHSQRDKKYDTLEDGLIEKLEEALPMMMNPKMILAAIQIVNSAKRRGSTEQGPPQGQTQIVQLVFPQVALRKFSTNTQNEVIEVDGRPMVSMPAPAILKKLQETNPLQIEAPNAELQQRIESASEVRTGQY